MKLIVKKNKDGGLCVGTTNNYTIPKMYSAEKHGYVFCYCSDGYWVLLPNKLAVLVGTDNVWFAPKNMTYNTRAKKALGW